MNCANCEYARETGGKMEDKVGCGYWSVLCYEGSHAIVSESQRNNAMFEAGLHDVWTGWVLLQQRPGEGNPEKLLGSEIMTNFSIIVPSDSLCSKYKERNH